MARCLHLPTISPVGPRLGLDAAVHPGHAVSVVDVTPQHHLAAVALVGGAGIDAGPGFHRHLGGLAHLATALPITAHQHGAAARGAFGFDAAGGGQGDVVGLQVNLAAFGHQAVGLQAAAVFDDPGLQFVECHRRQDDLPIGRLHRQLVLNQRGNGVGRGGDARQATALHLQADDLARGQGHRARAGQHHTGVLHLRGEQGHIAAQPRADAPLVDHFACRTVALKLVIARHEIGVADAVAGGHQCTHVHRRCGREVHAAGVAQKHLAVGCDAAKDLAGVVVVDAVQGDGLCIGLHKVDAGSGTEVEAVPVDDSALAALVDRHGRCLGGGGLADGGAAACHAATHGQLGAGRWRGRLGPCTTQC